MSKLPNAPVIDEDRFEWEWAADQDVLASLAGNGDRANILRMVDVSFVGSKADLAPIEEDAETLGFTIGQMVESDDGTWRLDLDIMQTVEPDAIKALTRKCLEIEATYPGVEYDGWGCVTQTGSTH